jgi:hypothetical protein
MTHARAKQILEKNGRKYTDAEVTALWEHLRKLAILQIEIEDKNGTKISQNHLYRRQ